MTTRTGQPAEQPPEQPAKVAPSIASERACKGSTAETGGVRVAVKPEFVADQSDPDSRQYLFTYQIRVTNTGDAPVLLSDRHWIIVDAHGEKNEVRGAGVVGKQPKIMPGETFEYSSFVQLATPWGTMEGEYTMHKPHGETFSAKVARFFLVSPFDGRKR